MMKGCIECARKEIIGLNKAKNLWLQQAGESGEYKALRSNVRKKTSSSRMAVTERNCIKGTMANHLFVEGR